MIFELFCFKLFWTLCWVERLGSFVSIPRDKWFGRLFQDTPSSHADSWTCLLWPPKVISILTLHLPSATLKCLMVWQGQDRGSSGIASRDNPCHPQAVHRRALSMKGAAHYFVSINYTGIYFIKQFVFAIYLAQLSHAQILAILIQHLWPSVDGHKWSAKGISSQC